MTALSRSRSSARRSMITPAISEMSRSPIVVDSPSPISFISIPDPPNSGSPYSGKFKKVSKVDLFGEAACDSEGAISVTDEDCDAVNAVLSPQEYENFNRPRSLGASGSSDIANVFLGLVFKFSLGQPGNSA